MPSGLRWRAWALVRPVLRPALHRLRTFFVGHLRDDVAALQREVAELRAALDRRLPVEERAVEQHMRVVMAEALATLALDPSPPADPRGQPEDDGSG